MSRSLKLIRYAFPYSLHVTAAVILMALVGLMDAFRVLLIGPIFDRVLNPVVMPRGIPLIKIPFFDIQISLSQLIPAHFQNDWTMVAFALVVSTFLKGICDYAGTYLINYAGFGVVTDLRNDLYDSILRRTASFFQQHSTGRLLSVIVNDVEKVQTALSTVLADFLQQAFTLIFTAAVVIGLGGKLSWILLAFIPVVLLSARKIGGKVSKMTRKGQDKLADIQHILQETITGNRIVKAFGMELFEIARFQEAARNLFRANLRSVRAQAISSPLMDVIGAAGLAMLLLLGRTQIQYGNFTAGGYITFLIAVFKLYDPVRKFSGYYINFQQAMGASQDIFLYLDSRDDVEQKRGATKLARFHKSVKFDGVCFQYDPSAAPLAPLVVNEGDTRESVIQGIGLAEMSNAALGKTVHIPRVVLKDINLEVIVGEVVAIVGSSGSGKSSLVNLVPRFFDVSAGHLLVDGVDVRDIDLHSLRDQIGIVTQETVLFNDTVKNNIAYGQPNIAQEKIENAAKAALAHEFILKMPEGYDTVIGERGVRLSGGERQRLSIARALLKNAPLLILDEATSALDTESEQLVQSALQNLMTGRTVLVIAHRLSTIRRANRIVVIDSGTIADIGTHDELMGRLGKYRQLHDMQFADTLP